MASIAETQEALNIFERGEDSPGKMARIGRKPIPCDLCPNIVALVDGATLEGPWAYLCAICFMRQGVGLGPGRGQVMLFGAKKGEM